MRSTVDSLKILVVDDKKNVALAVGATTGVILASIAFLYSRQKAKKNPPPPAIPAGLVGCIRAINDPCGQVPALLKWAEHLNFAPAMTIPGIPMKKVVLLVGAELSHEVLNDPSTTKPPIIYKGLSSVRGVSMVCQMNQVKWKLARKGVAPAFSGGHTRRMNEICHNQTELWIQDFLEPLAESGAAFDPCDGLHKLTISVIAKAAFDHDISEEEIQNYVEDIHIISEETNKRATFPARTWFHSVLPSMKLVNKSLARVEAFGQKLLDNHRKSPNPTRGTVLDLIDKNPHYEDDAARIRDIDLFVQAGFDTNGFTLAFSFYQLARQPKEMDKLRRALLKLPEAERTSCVELKNFITETLRMYPAIPLGSARLANRDFKVGDGSVISNGTIVIQAPILTQQNPNVFGIDAHIFRPDRWNDATEKMKASVVPFSMGRQNCIGQAFAMAEIRFVVAMVASRYRLELVKDCEPEASVVYQPRRGLIKVSRL